MTLLPLGGELEPASLLMAGPRFLGEHWSLDLGVITTQLWHELPRDGVIVLPWASFMFHWG